jgi:hypothetical protein
VQFEGDAGEGDLRIDECREIAGTGPAAGDERPRRDS